MFDPEKFGMAMGDAIKAAIAPIAAEIANIKSALELKADFSAIPVLPALPDFAALVAESVAQAVKGVEIPSPADGKDADMDKVREMVDAAVKSAVAEIPRPKDGVSISIADVQPLITEQIKEIATAIPAPLALAGALIDREGSLLITLSSGEIKNLGKVVGANGLDGISLESFEIGYLAESHEIEIKAGAAGNVKELRYPAGGIRPAGYWREGAKAKAGEAWVHDGSLWIAVKSNCSKPVTGSEDWIIAARKGRDGEDGKKVFDNTPPTPIKLEPKRG